MTRARDQSAQALVKKYGCPLEDLFKMPVLLKEVAGQLFERRQCCPLAHLGGSAAARGAVET